MYAQVSGSVAAPTAGLHFTPKLLEGIKSMGVEWAQVLLHIGLDTFRPVTEEQVEEHQIHTEYCELDAATAAQLNRARHEGRRIVAVGTTSVRVLETAGQSRTTDLEPFSGRTRLFIYPGYQFSVVDALITNFHLPRSSLLMLVSAFAGTERSARRMPPRLRPTTVSIALATACLYSRVGNQSLVRDAHDRQSIADGCPCSVRTSVLVSPEEFAVRFGTPMDHGRRLPSDQPQGTGS